MIHMFDPDTERCYECDGHWKHTPRCSEYTRWMAEQFAAFARAAGYNVRVL